MRLLNLYWLAPPRRALSHREQEVLEHLARGERTRLIAAEMGVSMKTVWTYYHHICQKWQLENSAQLRKVAVESTGQQVVPC